MAQKLGVGSVILIRKNSFIKIHDEIDFDVQNMFSSEDYRKGLDVCGVDIEVIMVFDFICCHCYVL